MKEILNEELINKQANEFVVDNYGVPTISYSQDTFDNAEEDFKAGVSWCRKFYEATITNLIAENQGLKMKNISREHL
jgi:hypothetical protein